MDLETLSSYGRLTTEKPEGLLVSIVVSQERFRYILNYYGGLERIARSIVVMRSYGSTVEGDVERALGIALALMSVPTREEALENILTEGQFRRALPALEADIPIGFIRAPRRKNQVL